MLALVVERARFPMLPQVPPKEAPVHHFAIGPQPCEVIAKDVSPRQIEVRAFANQFGAICGANKHVAEAKSMLRSYEFFWHSPNEIENEFAMDTNIVHSELSDTALNVLLA
jgi:hypothetical protein